MDEVYRQQFNANAVTSSPQAPKSTMAATSTSYTREALKLIGEECRTRLPAASLVQAMFMYEMQRQSEVEHLFQGQIFKLAKAEEAANKQTKLSSEMENRLAALEKKFVVRDVEERIATSSVRMNAQQEKLNAASGRLGWAEKRLDTLQQDIDDVRKSQKEAHAVTSTAAAVAAVKEEASRAIAAATAASAAASIPTPAPINLLSAEEMATVKEEINVLFDDRDGLLRIVEELKERLNKLEENVRMLTIQRSTPAVSPAATQRIPLKTTNGDLIDLSIPKGNPAVGLKENRPMEVRSFLPGKQWAL